MTTSNVKQRVLMTIYGTRPEAVKIAPIIHALRNHPHFHVKIVNTSQQKDLLGDLNNTLGITPDFTLEPQGENTSLNNRAGHMLSGIDRAIDNIAPDAVLVHGDTTTALMGALAAFNRGIPVIHIEAGLRSHNMASPFPEEANRVLTSQLASLHLAPTRGAKNNLMREGINENTIIVTGNTVVDALHTIAQQGSTQAHPDLTPLVSSRRQLVTITVHRRENWGHPAQEIAHALSHLATTFTDVDFVFPMHPNPKIRRTFQPLGQLHPNFHPIEALTYVDFIYLMTHSRLILSDSGGIQEEASALGKPVLILRENTERPEVLLSPQAQLVGHNAQKIIHNASCILTTPNPPATLATPFGDGTAAQRTVHAIEYMWQLKSRPTDYTPQAAGSAEV